MKTLRESGKHDRRYKWVSDIRIDLALGPTCLYSYSCCATTERYEPEKRLFLVLGII